MRATGIIIFSLLLLSGCSSVKIDTAGSNNIAPICNPGDNIIITAILWGALWRPDQKEPQLRESMAKQGIDQFISETKCINVVSNRKIELEQNAPSNAKLIELVTVNNTEQVIFILVRELGPTLEIGIPAIITGHTETVLETKVINLPSQSVINDSKVHWRKGGMFVIKGTSSLPKDIASALKSILTTTGG
jgi:hypothetical protein